MNLPILETIEYLPAESRAGLRANSRSVYIETYGCQMNVADSELVGSILNDAGFKISNRAESADIILLNTCAVREHAEERVIGRVSQLNSLRAQRPNLTIGILGCMAQHLSETLTERAPFVDIAMGPDSYRRLPDLLAQSGIKCTPLNRIKGAFSVPENQRRALTESTACMEGRLYIQNPSSMLPPMILSPKPGEEVLDLAAAPGGKTIHMADLMQNNGRIGAVESVKNRFFRLKENIERAGVDIVTTYLKDGRSVGRQCPEPVSYTHLTLPTNREV